MAALRHVRLGLVGDDVGEEGILRLNVRSERQVEAGEARRKPSARWRGRASVERWRLPLACPRLLKARQYLI